MMDIRSFSLRSAAVVLASALLVSCDRGKPEVTLDRIDANEPAPTNLSNLEERLIRMEERQAMSRERLTEERKNNTKELHSLKRSIEQLAEQVQRNAIPVANPVLEAEREMVRQKRKDQDRKLKELERQLEGFQKAKEEKAKAPAPAKEDLIPEVRPVIVPTTETAFIQSTYRPRRYSTRYYRPYRYGYNSYGWAQRRSYIRPTVICR